MNFICIYGAPAAGKFTVAVQLAKLTGYKLLDNHTATDWLLDIFPRSERFDSVRSKLGRQVRLDVFEAAATAGVNLITTFMPMAKGWQEFAEESKKTVEQAGGTAYFVHMQPSREVILQRVVHPERRGTKLRSTERWQDLEQSHPHIHAALTGVEQYTIDNSYMSPREAAQNIIDHFGLL